MLSLVVAEDCTAENLGALMQNLQGMQIAAAENLGALMQNLQGMQIAVAERFDIRRAASCLRASQFHAWLELYPAIYRSVLPAHLWQQHVDVLCSMGMCKVHCCSLHAD